METLACYHNLEKLRTSLDGFCKQKSFTDESPWGVVNETAKGALIWSWPRGRSTKNSFVVLSCERLKRSVPLGQSPSRSAAHRCFVVPRVYSDRLARRHLPEAGGAVRRGGDEKSSVDREHAIPHPPRMPLQGALQCEAIQVP
eukprot:7486946-Pyramimonas_sp.AAC.2